VTARVRILYWQDVPSLVKASDESGGEAKRQLADWFQQEIDRRAMAQGLTGTDAYLEQWRWGDEVEHDGSAADAVDAVAAELDAAAA
jgi:hypothetical protein